MPTAYTFGNERRNDLTGPAYRDVDFSAFKDFIITGEARVQFRAELFNILNTTNYSTPDASVQDGTFGQILTAMGSMLGRAGAVVIRLFMIDTPSSVKLF